MAGANYHNMIRRVIEQRNKKNSMEYGWLSKTGQFDLNIGVYSKWISSTVDMTIVAVSILFVVLLATINLILFAVRR